MNESATFNTQEDYMDQYFVGSSSNGGVVAPFFSMRKLRLVYNELMGSRDFEFSNFDDFKQNVLSSVAPQIELSKWQAIASRR
ncbi:hypothetical protein [Agaribacter marinus]|uniref:Uncharacterized protein n=1 Tax=Agaribacter marinus TaxID=1431249 RepID=A0AA37T0H2_9ALTE|nr:hypothetical protein [Agaribacter marinus]GLR70163.1 hypothetical protein GCM10007852_10710 [Agaribacter marinus]